VDVRSFVHEILGHTFQSLSDYLCGVSFKKHSSFGLEVVEKPNKCISFYSLIFFFGGGRPDFFTPECCQDLLSTVWQSLVEFRLLVLLVSICEAWQLRRMQNLQRVGRNDGPILNRLCPKVHDILR